jgi:hypothetical protein
MAPQEILRGRPFGAGTITKSSLLECNEDVSMADRIWKLRMMWCPLTPSLKFRMSDKMLRTLDHSNNKCTQGISLL